MTTEPSGGISEENNRILDAMNFARMNQAAALAHAHHAFARPDVLWEDLTRDEQASAIIAAYPWMLAVRALHFGGCPRCGTASGDIIDLGGGRKQCSDCGHNFEFVED
jgi:hypothetical protein